MSAGKVTQQELVALRREVEALRAERREAMAAGATQFGVDASSEAPTHDASTGSRFDLDWDEVKAVVDDLAEELGKVTHQHPVVGMAGAFVLGLLIGRSLSR